MNMIMKADPDLLITIVFLVGVISFFIGSLMNEILGDVAFGLVGNMFYLILGAIFGILGYDNFVLYGAKEIHMAVSGVAGAFGTLTAFIVLKAILVRFGL